MTISSPKPKLWECRYLKVEIPRVIVVHLKGESVLVEDGPENPGARNHQGVGGRQSFESFLENPSPWTEDFPELYLLVRRAVSAASA